MSCPDEEVLSAYSDGETAPSEVREVRRHLVACERCRLRLNGIERAKSSLRELPAPGMPADLRESLRSLARSAPASSGQGFWAELMAGLRHPASAFSLAVAVCVALLLWGRSSGPLTPETTVPADLLVAAHDQYALTMPLAPAEAIMTEMPRRLALDWTDRARRAAPWGESSDAEEELRVH